MKTIAYFDADGKAHPSSAAIADGTVGRNQVFVEYKDGTVIVANGNLKERLKTKVENTVIDLPSRAFKGWTQDGQIQAEISEDAVGKRIYFCDCPEFTYKDGNLVKKPLCRKTGQMKAPCCKPPARLDKPRTVCYPSEPCQGGAAAGAWDGAGWLCRTQ